MDRQKFEDFTSKQKKMILKRDNYRCVVCGLGKENGSQLHIYYIRPKELGGTSTITNGQTLCSKHYFIKSELKETETETGKKMFIRLYEAAKSEQNQEIINFCTEILRLYQKFHINSHIKWKP